MALHWIRLLSVVSVSVEPESFGVALPRLPISNAVCCAPVAVQVQARPTNCLPVVANRTCKALEWREELVETPLGLAEVLSVAALASTVLAFTALVALDFAGVAFSALAVPALDFAGVGGASSSAYNSSAPELQLHPGGDTPAKSKPRRQRLEAVLTLHPKYFPPELYGKRAQHNLSSLAGLQVWLARIA